jgi:hypothetical protein
VGFATLVCYAMLCGQAADVPPAEQTAAPAAGEAAASTEDLKTQVARLVKQLDANELAQREAAEQQLVALGSAALDLLPQPSNKMSAEVKERLGRVRDKLQRAEAVAVVQPSKVTIDVQSQPLSKVLAEFTKQTGNAFTDYREQMGQEARDPKISLKVDAVPFWQAVDQALDVADSTLYAYADEAEEDALAVIDRPISELPRQERAFSYSGPFRLEATTMEANVDLRNPMARSLALLLDVAWEPRLRPVNLEVALADVSAADESGNAIAVEAEEERTDIQIVPGEHVTEVRIPLVMPARSVGKIASLKGKFTALVPGREETFRFDDFKKANQEQRRSGVVVGLERVRKNNDVWEFRVRVRFDDAAGALQSHMGWIFNNEAFLETSDGQKIEPDGTETYRQTEDEVGVAYLFGIEGKLTGHTLVYKTPTVIVPLPIEFELKEMELP